MFEMIEYLFFGHKIFGLNIKKGDLVLDVGSGHNPHPKASILTDLYMSDNTERNGSRLVIDKRPFVRADICHLPFKDKSIDYVFTRQIITHIDDVEKALAELQRVGKRGLIDSPGILGQLMSHFSFYSWWIDKQNGKLVFMPFKGFYNELAPVFTAFGKMQSNYLPYNMLMFLFPKSYRVEYEWNGKIDYQILDGSNIKVSREISTPTKKSNFSNISGYARKIIKRMFQKTMKNN